jgi:hypothetical protein
MGVPVVMPRRLPLVPASTLKTSKTRHGRRLSMFGRMNVVPILDLRQTFNEVGASFETAVVRLLDVTEHPTIAKWVQFPKALFVFLIVPGETESGAFYVFDRRKRLWY